MKRLAQFFWKMNHFQNKRLGDTKKKKKKKEFVKGKGLKTRDSILVEFHTEHGVNTSESRQPTPGENSSFRLFFGEAWRFEFYRVAEFPPARNVPERAGVPCKPPTRSTARSRITEGETESNKRDCVSMTFSLCTVERGGPFRFSAIEEDGNRYDRKAKITLGDLIAGCCTSDYQLSAVMAQWTRDGTK